jgi:hypothetical protein
MPELAPVTSATFPAIFTGISGHFTTAADGQLTVEKLL